MNAVLKKNAEMSIKLLNAVIDKLPETMDYEKDALIDIRDVILIPIVYETRPLVNCNTLKNSK